MGPQTLAQVLCPLKNMFDPHTYGRLLSGLEDGDDAAVYQLDDTTAIIFTVDFITPIVDDPYLFGAIAASNALSDIFAMGGKVLMALNICAFPTDFQPEVIGEILRGGAEKVLESGGVLAGGHTVIDKEPKYGLTVIGTIHPDHLLTKSGAKAGDLLVLTKPLGTGIVSTAFKGELAHLKHMESAANSMKELNKSVSEILCSLDVHACTDITGFALIGHTLEFAHKSNVSITLHVNSLPFLDGAKEYAEQWLFPEGTFNNERCYKPHIHFSSAIATPLQLLLYTPETSGGLLFALPKGQISTLRSQLEQQNRPFWIIGEITEGAPSIHIEP